MNGTWQINGYDSAGNGISSEEFSVEGMESVADIARHLSNLEYWHRHSGLTFSAWNRDTGESVVSDGYYQSF